MTGGFTLEDTLAPFIVLFQLTIAGLVLTAGPRSAVRAAFATVLVANAWQAFQQLVTGGCTGTLVCDSVAYADAVILLSVAFLLSQFPVPLGGSEGARLARRLWIGLLAAWTLTWLYTTLAWGQPNAGWVVFHEPAFALGAALLAVHLVPKWSRLLPGPLRTQAMVVGAGLGATLAFTSVHQTAGMLVGGGLASGSWSGRIGKGVWVEMLFFLTIAVAWGTATAVRRRNAADLLVPATLTLCMLLGTADRTFLVGVIGSTKPELAEFLPQTVRPAFIAVAMLRYDLFAVPLKWRKTLVPMTLAFFALALFTLFIVLLSRSALQLEAIAPVHAMGAAACVLVVAHVARRPIGGLLAAARRAPGEPQDDLQRLERYRLELERARAGGTPDAPALAALREQYGITDAEHRVLESILASHVVIPTRAVRGARPGERVMGRYEVERELGRGGHGRALLARDVTRNEPVVLKELLRPWEEHADRRRAAVTREAAVGARVNSPFLARVQGVVTDADSTYLIREFVPGRPLDDAVEQDGPLVPEDAERVLRDVLAGLAILHARGLLHLDLKPQNVIASRERTVIIDFGTARALPGSAGGEAPVTSTTVTATAAGGSGRDGTLRWMAPEQVLGRALDARTDVFAAGALLHYLLSGRSHVGPDGLSAFEIEHAIVHGAPPPMPDGTPEHLANTIRRALSRAPADRFPSAEAFLEALDAPVART